MRVVQARSFGGPEVLVTVEAPDPVAGPGEVVIDVAVADTLFVETQIRSGWGRAYFEVTPPYVPGGGVAGRVASVGEGVDGGWIGRLVVARTRTGGYVEQAVGSVEALVAVPEGLGIRAAASLMADGVTALGVVEPAWIQLDEWVLVVAAGGGMGVLLVQFAHAAGARVIAAARGQRKLDLARELGAEVVVDYTEPDWTDRVRDATGGTGAQVVFDGAGGKIGLGAFEVTARGGRLSAHGAPSGGFAEIDPLEAARRGITLRGITDLQFDAADARRRLEHALSEAAAGRLRPIIGQTFPLDRAADAHAAIEAREVIGKTLLLV